ncbi:unnamed protein product [Allacma fusca]|uniref:Uncharacterized protein n=1 Tax=Allacma fusca TaxID=39272 RepID=A0A8J2P2X1_9HEXA|nr:unnamed protein product [Allacma fusca]
METEVEKEIRRGTRNVTIVIFTIFQVILLIWSLIFSIFTLGIRKQKEAIDSFPITTYFLNLAVTSVFVILTITQLVLLNVQKTSTPTLTTWMTLAVTSLVVNLMTMCAANLPIEDLLLFDTLLGTLYTFLISLIHIYSNDFKNQDSCHHKDVSVLEV